MPWVPPSPRGGNILSTLHCSAMAPEASPPHPRRSASTTAQAIPAFYRVDHLLPFAFLQAAYATAGAFASCAFCPASGSTWRMDSPRKANR